MKDAFEASLAQLEDYVRGHQPEEQAEDYELDLFQRALAGQAPELQFRSRVAATVRSLGERGTLNLYLTRAEVDQLLASKLSVAFLEYDPQTLGQFEIPADAEVLVTKVPLDLRDVTEVEVEVVAEDGRTVKRMPDVAFDAEAGAFYACCEAELARVASSTRRSTRVWSIEPSGRRLLAELPVA